MSKIKVKHTPLSKADKFWDNSASVPVEKEVSTEELLKQVLVKLDVIIRLLEK
jgi:hypothetical protein